MAITYSQHSNLTAADIHALTRWTVVDTAARLALSLTSADNGKLLHQTDSDSYWILADWSVPTWVELSSSGVAAVTSIFTRTGDVTAQPGDYSKSDVGLGNVENLKVNLVATTDPGAGDNAGAGYGTGSLWVNTATDTAFLCVDAAAGSWQEIGAGGDGSALTIEDSGTPLTTNATKINFAGSGVTLTEPVADEITVTVAAGSAPVDSIFTRTGAVVAEASDYNASQIDNDATNANGNVTGAYVSSALDTADAAIEANTTAAASAQADATAAQNDASAAKAKTDFLTITQTVNLDTVESDTASNTAAAALNTTHRGSDGSDHSKVAANESAIAALGTASAEDVGVTIGDVVQLENVGGSPGMPAVDGSQLTGLTSSGAIDVEEAGVPKVTDATTMNFTGGGVTVVDAGGGEATVTIAPGAAPVDTVFGRTGTVVATASDYDASQVDNDSSVLGGTSTVAAALTQLDTDITNKTVDVVSNVASGVILGRDTAGSGNSEELSPAETRTLLGLPNTTTDDALARYDGITGTQQDSPVTLADAGSMSWPGAVTVIDQTGLETNTVQAKEALRTWKDHVQYGVAAPTVGNTADRGIWWVDNTANPVEPKFRQDDGTDLNLKDGVDAKADLATHTTDQTYTHDQIDAAVDGLTNHVGDTDNPHSTSLANIDPGTHSNLESAVPDAGTIFASLQTGQVAGLDVATVAAGDHILIEDADSTPTANAKKRIAASDLLLSANNLSDVTAATARTNLGVDAAGTDNSTDVTLAGTPDYITIAGQVITRNAIVATTDLSATGTKDSTTFLRGDDTWAVPTGSSIITGTSNPPVDTTDFVAGEFYYVTTSQELWYNDAGTPERVGVVADGTSIEVDATNGLQLVDVDTATVGHVPKKKSGGGIEWGEVSASRTPENKAPVRAATVTAGAESASYDNGSVIEGTTTLATGDRILVKDGFLVQLGSYVYDDALAGNPDANGEAKPDGNDLTLVGSIDFYDSNTVGTDNSAIFADMRIGDRIKLGTTSYTVDGTPVDNGTYWTIPVDYRESALESFPDTLVTETAQGIHNGIYIVNASGAPTLATDWASASGQAGAQVWVQEGLENGDKIFLCTNNVGSDVVGTDRIVFANTVQPSYSTGFGAFKATGESPAVATNTDNGGVNVGSSMLVSGLSAIGIRFSGKPFERDWGYASGAPLHVQSIMSQSAGPGAHIIMRQQDDPKKICIIRNESFPTVITNAGLNDDTRYEDITVLGATFKKFEDKLYETTVIPQSPTSTYSGSAVLTLSGSTFGKRWGWPQTSHQDWNWGQAFAGATSAPTLAPYDHTGILMPADGAVLNFYVQMYVEDGTSYWYKPELTRLRPDDDASTFTNTAMTSASTTAAPTAAAGEMDEFEMTKEGLNAAQLVETTFQKGDKLLITVHELVNTGTVTSARFEWGLRVGFKDPVPVGEAPGD